jgi:hypothetical protein
VVHLAVARHNLESLKLLLANPHVKLDLQNDEGCVPLHMCVPAFCVSSDLVAQSLTCVVL